MENLRNNTGIEIYKSTNPYSNVLLIPGLPNNGINSGITELFVKNNSNLIFINDKSFGVDLEKNTEQILDQIIDGKIEGINKDLPLFLVGFSFGGGISLKYIKNGKIEKIIALSPLFNETGKNIDFEGLFNYIQKISGSYLQESIEDFKKRIDNLLKIDESDFKDYKKFKIVSIDEDPEIQIPEKYNPLIFKSSDLGITHFGLRKTGNLGEENKKKIFSEILDFNSSREFEQYFMDNILEQIGKENIYGIMTHGSRAFNNNISEKSDLDFILVLNENKSGFIEKIKNILDDFRKNYNINIDLSLFFRDSILELGWENVMTSTHNPSYSNVFSNSKTLYGENIFFESRDFFSDKQCRNDSNLEIGKYVDRLNRLYFLDLLDESQMIKNLSRIIMSYMLANNFLNYYDSNNYNLYDASNFIEKRFSNFLFKDLFLGILNNDKSCLENKSKFIEAINTFLKEYGNNNILTERNLNGLLNASKIYGYKNSLYIPKLEKYDFDGVFCISCLAFSDINILSTEEKLTEDQIFKNFISSATMMKIINFFKNFGKNISGSVKIGDFGLELEGDSKENAKNISKQQSFLENQLKDIFGKEINISKLSSDLLEENERKFGKISYNNKTYDDFIEILGNEKYNLSEEFIKKYLEKIFSKNGESLLSEKVLNIVFSSIKEHLELSYRISNKYKNKVFFFIGNEKKIELMREVFKSSKENTNIFIGLSEK